MTPFTALNKYELAAVNQARREEGRPLLGSSSWQTVQATAIPFMQTISDQRYTPPPSLFAQNVSAAIATKLGKRRYTRPSEPEGEPGDFAEQLAAATRKRRRGYPKPQPKTN
jgi:hypothetical protein